MGLLRKQNLVAVNQNWARLTNADVVSSHGAFPLKWFWTKCKTLKWRKLRIDKSSKSELPNF